MSGAMASSLGSMENKKKSKEIKNIHVRKMDGGGFTVRAETGDYGPDSSYESAHESAKEALAMVHNHMTSPHLPKLGSGERFKELSDELAKKPGVTNPDGLAAKIGRSRYGNKRFSALAQRGK